MVTSRDERAWVHTAQGVGDHELGPQQAHAVDGEGRGCLGTVGDGEVHVQPRGERLGRGAVRDAVASGEDPELSLRAAADDYKRRVEEAK